MGGSGPTHVVTGAFGYSGKYIAKRLLARGHNVITLTNSPHRAGELAGQVEPRPLSFGKPDALAASLRGASVLYNTYWVRFNHREFKHEDAVANTKALFAAAKDAGVGRIVHVSITNPSLDSPLEYFSGKARLEEALAATGIPHSILRPTVLFGREDILINNIAWMLRRLPVFGVFGDGGYRLQPIHVDDLARLAVEQGEASGDRVIDAIGPETFTYRGLVEMLGEAIGCPRPIIGVSPALGLFAGWVLGKLVGDIVITKEEIEGLMADLLHVESPSAGQRRLTDWAATHRETLGRRYASELRRRLNRRAAYVRGS